MNAREGGVALVVTLIMLSLITFLTVAFLTLGRREKASVTVDQSQTDARLAADIAAARAQLDIVGQVMQANSLLVSDPKVSRNFINENGFDPGEGAVNTTNVNYEQVQGGGALSPDQLVENVGNIFYDGRAPVFVRTNFVNPNAPLDFRFYLDLNRNGRFDPNGFGNETNNLGAATGTNRFFQGDPEWIAVMGKPEYPHSPTNPAVARYAYLLVPEGQNLDANYIHNYAKGNLGMAATMNAGDGFLRNQGVAPWEINLAGLFYNLNTNLWATNTPQPYTYDTNNTANRGVAFDDALAFVSNRYGGSFTVGTLPSANTTLGGFGGNLLENNLVDDYADGPLLTGTGFTTNENDAATQPWAGSRNAKVFTDPADFLDPGKTSQDFVDRLKRAGASPDSYDRYTYYRLLTQLGVNSAPESQRINLNYDNLTAPSNGVANVTNYLAWEPVVFFTNASQRLLQRALTQTNASGITNYFLAGVNLGTNPVSMGNIQVYPVNQYTPALHRLLQVAANIYGAATPTTNRMPYVFRPRFESFVANNQTNVFIRGYKLAGTNDLQSPVVGLDGSPVPSGNWTAFGTNSEHNVLGIPWVVSVQKGLPNLNEFKLLNVAAVTRKIQIRRMTNAGNLEFTTNIAWFLGVTNEAAVEVWNSYAATYPNQLTIFGTNYFRAQLTNSAGLSLRETNVVFPFRTNNLALRGGNFVVPLNTNVLFLRNEQFMDDPADLRFRRVSLNNPQFLENGRYSAGDWVYRSTNYLFCVMLDQHTGQMVDVVNLALLPPAMNVTNMLYDESSPSPLAIWNPSRIDGTTNITSMLRGVRNQVVASLGGLAVTDWEPIKGEGAPTVDDQIATFAQFMNTPPYRRLNLTRDVQINYNEVADVPYAPTVTKYQSVSLQANDPLVHYMVEDLRDKSAVFGAIRDEIESTDSTINPTNSLAGMNSTYQPWGRNQKPERYDLSLQDAGVRRPDDWEFPTNKFPSIGWLGRVHRGTPWQTIYLKSAVPTADAWNKWAGGHALPSEDWALVDLFTAAPNDNATRGLLSVNQTNVGAWSALLSGVVVLSNSLPDGDSRLDPQNTNRLVLEPLVIHPDNVQAVVNALNTERAKRPNGVFSTVGDILSVPQLTVTSPYLNTTNTQQTRYGINDTAYEWLPQQLLSLLKVGEPRFAVYAYGQSLKPAENSIVLNPPSGRPELLNLCTNYQITGETVTRTVFRIEGTPKQPKVVVESFNILSAQ